MKLKPTHVALLKNGVRIGYDKVETITETSGNKTRKLHHFYRAKLGLVAIISEDRLEKLEA